MNIFSSTFISKILLTLACVAVQTVGAQEITGKVETSLVIADSIPSWQSKGIGLIRGEGDAIELQQSFVSGVFSISPNWQAKAVLNAYSDGEEHLGFTQAYLQYKPLSRNTIKFKSRIGLFYPEMSVENTNNGWLSPYTYTQSAINSWIGEELRTLGGEATWFSNGRKRRSPWSWEATIGVYKGNDTLGTLIAWRGFAMHDRQSLHNDKVQFAAIPSIQTISSGGSPTYVEPFTEIDGKWGAYVGAHLSYLRKTNIRYYYYDNNADPTALNSDQLYGWRTKFHSLALQHQLSDNWRITTQTLSGSTLMGANKVYVDFVAAYIGVSYAKNKHRTSLRLDYNEVNEYDARPNDPNNSDGNGITLAWRYQVNQTVELGAEFHQQNSTVENRALINEPVSLQQPQVRIVLGISF